MSNVTLLQYNNYFNRIIKKEASYANYLVAATANQQYTSINFVPGDSVRTSIVLGTSALNMSYDYLLVHHTENGNVVIDSRWFIMDENRTRDGQYEVTLKRDVIIDNYNKVIAAPMFMEKGFVSSLTNPLLYNKESMTYNQIKDSEKAIADSTECGWVVGYIPQDAFKEITEISKDIPIEGTITADHTTGSLNGWTYYDAISTNPTGHVWTSSSALQKVIYLDTKYAWGPFSSPPVETHKVRTLLYSGSGIGVPEDFGTTNPDAWSSVTYRTEDSNFYQHFEDNIREAYWDVSVNNNIWECYDAVAEELGFNLKKPYEVKTAQQIQALLNLDGDILYVESTRSYYRIDVVGSSGATTGVNIINAHNTKDALLNEINNSIIRSGQNYAQWRVDGNHSDWDTYLGTTGPAYVINLTQITYPAKVVLDDNRAHVLDAPYDIFCIPYSDTNYVRTSIGTARCSKKLAVGMAQAIAAQAGSQSVYDVQLLPYCPSAELVIANPSQGPATFVLTSLSTSLIMRTEDNTLAGAIIWCTSCNRSFDLTYPTYAITVSDNVIDRKVENECDLYRLCSGNYQGMFEFSAAKSYGVTGFHVDCTFKPYNPYIHVAPMLKGLYGSSFSSFNDSRGLICGGDFSLAQLSNAWANYELQNKNYQNIFDRQIQSMDLNNSIARQEAGWNIAAGVVGGGVGGAMTGASVGGGYGAVAGAVIGAGSSLIGGMMDYANLEKRQEDAKDYAIDMFGYQLGNIQALPTSLARNSALTANTKVFPFVEKYTCTATEKQALRDKITYDGMTMMVISTLSTYMVSGTPHFFKGKIIRLDSLGADNHMAQAIYEELYKGVYI